MAPIGYLNLYVVLYKRSQNLYLSSTQIRTERVPNLMSHCTNEKSKDPMLHVWTIYIHDSLIFLKGHKIKCTYNAIFG